ncbi:FtsK/SpoIIIE domain-containing protein [Paenarthrobacter ureafaciens]
MFLFIDFKGGSGLGPLERLPHCAGLVTDLGGQGMKRVLESLRSEIRYREEAFHAGGVADIKDYRPPASGSVGPIPRLVLVIDEFRMLVDEEPAALRELMRIAAVGRSLGLHLVMATQRPQGALTADIRANVTTSIALRVQSEAESTDIIKTGVAAGIPVRLPGRAFLARAFGAPEEFQSASVLVAHRGHLDETCVQPALDGPDTRDGDDSDALGGSCLGVGQSGSRPKHPATGTPRQIGGAVSAGVCGNDSSGGNHHGRWQRSPPNHCPAPPGGDSLGPGARYL